ncbi:multidrug transporter, partial [Corynebacterium sp.]
MTYTKRTLWLHSALFILAFLAFILPVVFGTSALLPVWLTGGLSLGLAACALVDAAYKFFAPTSPRSLRLLSGLAGLVLLIGWGIWVYIYGNMAA